MTLNNPFGMVDEELFNLGPQQIRDYNVRPIAPIGIKSIHPLAGGYGQQGGYWNGRRNGGGYLHAYQLASRTRTGRGQRQHARHPSQSRGRGRVVQPVTPSSRSQRPSYRQQHPQLQTNQQYYSCPDYVPPQQGMRAQDFGDDYYPSIAQEYLDRNCSLSTRRQQRFGPEYAWRDPFTRIDVEHDSIIHKSFQRKRTQHFMPHTRTPWGILAREQKNTYLGRFGDWLLSRRVNFFPTGWESSYGTFAKGIFYGREDNLQFPDSNQMISQTIGNLSNFSDQHEFRYSRNLPISPQGVVYVPIFVKSAKISGLQGNKIFVDYKLTSYPIRKARKKIKRRE